LKLKYNIENEIPVMEHFYTLQGEGVHSGKAAYFIRLAGCDVGCSWCDVKESWDANEGQILSISEVVDAAYFHPSRLVVITGGEPLMYNLEPLITSLRDNHFEVNIETSGTYPLLGIPDWICLSPKKFKSPIPEILRIADELKIIINHPSDLEWAKQWLPFLKHSCVLSLQPEWERRERFTPLIIDFIKTNPQWRLSLQTHKYLNIP
jgi:organic radical activating enzyme